MPVRGVGNGGMPLLGKLLEVHEPDGWMRWHVRLLLLMNHSLFFSVHTFLRIINLYVWLAVAQSVCGLAPTENVKLLAVGAAGRVVHRLGHRGHGMPSVAVRQVDAASDWKIKCVTRLPPSVSENLTCALPSHCSCRHTRRSWSQWPPPRLRRQACYKVIESFGFVSTLLPSTTYKNAPPMAHSCPAARCSPWANKFELWRPRCSR